MVTQGCSQIDGEGKQAASPPLRHGCDEFACVAVSIPFVGIRVGPACRGRWVLIVKNALHHTRVEQQAFDFLALKFTSFVGWLAVDEELIL